MFCYTEMLTAKKRVREADISVQNYSKFHRDPLPVECTLFTFSLNCMFRSADMKLSIFFVDDQLKPDKKPICGLFELIFFLVKARIPRRRKRSYSRSYGIMDKTKVGDIERCLYIVIIMTKFEV